MVDVEEMEPLTRWFVDTLSTYCATAALVYCKKVKYLHQYVW